MNRLLAAVTAAVSVAGAAVGPAAAPARAAGLQEVMFVGNNWDGTADVLRGSGRMTRIARVNVVPDRAERMAAIKRDLIRWLFYLGIRNGVGEGHDQLVDDMYSTPDGSAMVVSRPSFADVVSIDLRTGKVRWRFPVAGYRSDHMAVSPDGRRVAVSASLSNTVHVLDIETGRQVGSFGTGDKPHENFFSADGRYIVNMAIGNVETSLDAPFWDFTKGNRRLTVVDARTFARVRTIDMRSRLDAAGRGDLSNAVRPAVFTPDLRTLYFQVSFFNGFIEYDVATDKVTRIKTLPGSAATSPDRTTWINDSRHHGLSMNPSGTKLCVAGTMDDYATVVDRATLTQGPLVPASKPYWATVSGDGRRCIISESGSDKVTAIDFATGRKLFSVPVGDHPQRVRLAHVPSGWTGPAS